MSTTVTRIDKHAKVPFVKIGEGVVEQPALPFFETRESLISNITGVVNRASFKSSDPRHRSEVRILHSLLPSLNAFDVRGLLHDLIDEVLKDGDDYAAVSIARVVDAHIAKRDAGLVTE